MRHRLDVRTLSDGILMRLFVVASCLIHQHRPDDDTDWQHVTHTTYAEICRRELSGEDLRLFALADSQSIASLLATFQDEAGHEQGRPQWIH